jgi:hypothetical protein
MFAVQKPAWRSLQLQATLLPRCAASCQLGLRVTLRGNRCVYCNRTIEQCSRTIHLVRSAPSCRAALVDRDRQWRPENVLRLGALLQQTLKRQALPVLHPAAAPEMATISLVRPLPRLPGDHVQAELTFDGLAFIVSVKCSSGDCLEVAVEQRDDASTWSATFAAKCT